MGVVWRYAGNNKDSNPELNPWIYNVEWNSITLNRIQDQAGKFSLKLATADRRFETEVSPVLKEKDYKKAIEDFNAKLVAYENRLSQIEAERERVNQEASLLRSFQVESFGIYNWDCQYKTPNAVKLTAEFKFEDNIDMDINNLCVFLVAQKSQTVVKYPAGTWDKFAFDPNEKNQLIAILPGNKLAFFDENDFEQLDINYLSKSAHPSYTFLLRSKPEKVNSLDDLNLVLNI